MESRSRSGATKPNRSFTVSSRPRGKPDGPGEPRPAPSTFLSTPWYASAYPLVCNAGSIWYREGRARSPGIRPAISGMITQWRRRARRCSFSNRVNFRTQRLPDASGGQQPISPTRGAGSRLREAARGGMAVRRRRRKPATFESGVRKRTSPACAGSPPKPFNYEKEVGNMDRGPRSAKLRSAYESCRA